MTNRRSHREKIFQQTIFCHFLSLFFSPLLSSIIHSASPHLETEVKRFQSGNDQSRENLVFQKTGFVDYLDGLDDKNHVEEPDNISLAMDS